MAVNVETPARGAVEARTAAPTGAAAPVRSRAGFFKRWGIMARVGVHMMMHDRLKLLGTLVGVIFAVVLSNQQAGTFLGLLQKNILLAENVQTDLWVLPRSMPTLQNGQSMPISVLHRARVVPGVEWAEPLLYGGGAIKLPSGGTEAVSLMGTRLPRLAGGPWNIVAGEARSLAQPDAVFFEDSQRDTLGGLNLGSVRELNGRRVHAVGFTWGLLPFGPPLAFTEYDTARSMLGLASDQTHFVLIGVAPGADARAVQRAVAARLPEAQVLTKKELERKIVMYLLTRTAIGISFGVSTIFALIVGFVIVALTMFSAVLDNLREFGTLKAMGATTRDLAQLLLVQSVLFALGGSLVGLTLVTRMSEAIRSPQLALVLPPQLFAGTTVFMVLMCMTASTLALVRVRSVEPGMVFR